MRREPPWCATAFGLELEGDFELPGVAECGRERTRRRTVLEVVPADELEHCWLEDEATRVLEWRRDGGAIGMAVDRHPSLGYRLFSDYCGTFLVSVDGARVRCAPAAIPAWSWQRFLIGHVLPLAAVLQGLEVLHASAVSLAGGVVGFLGSSTAGKSSVAVNMLLRGAGFVTDDVLAVEAREGGVVAHPGVGITNVREAEAQLLGDAREQLGRLIGRDGGAFRLEVRPVARAQPLRARYFLERGRGTGPAPRFERLGAPDPRTLLATTANFYVTAPERLATQLDTWARIAASTELFRASGPAGVGAAELAEAIAAHAAPLMPTAG